ncbi:MAG: helix-turn-helix domain-containing protein, partial [Bacteroidales bacterium]|nr:helix-turn-helix domain-containing protein [Bacteroidales bacterium]
MINTISLLKKHLANYSGLDHEILDITWEFINSNYDCLAQAFKRNQRNIVESLPLGFASNDIEQIKTIFVFASGIKEVELTGSVQDIKSLQQIIEKQSKTFKVLEDENKKIKQILNDFRNEMKEIITTQNNRPQIAIPKDYSPFHVPYKITLSMIKRQGTLIVHTNRKNISIPLTKIQFAILTHLAQKSKDDEDLPYDEQGWVTYGELKNNVESWSDRSDNALLRTQIKFIRKKLKDFGVPELLIETLDGVGYR